MLRAEGAGVAGPVLSPCRGEGRRLTSPGWHPFSACPAAGDDTSLAGRARRLRRCGPFAGPLFCAVVGAADLFQRWLVRLLSRRGAHSLLPPSDEEHPRLSAAPGALRAKGEWRELRSAKRPIRAARVSRRTGPSRQTRLRVPRQCSSGTHPSSRESGEAIRAVRQGNPLGRDAVHTNSPLLKRAAALSLTAVVVPPVLQNTKRSCRSRQPVLLRSRRPLGRQGCGGGWVQRRSPEEVQRTKNTRNRCAVCGPVQSARTPVCASGASPLGKAVRRLLLSARVAVSLLSCAQHPSGLPAATVYPRRRRVLHPPLGRSERKWQPVLPKTIWQPAAVSGTGLALCRQR